MTCGLHNKVDGHENHNCCECNASIWIYPKICERKDRKTPKRALFFQLFRTERHREDSDRLSAYSREG